MPKIEDMSDDDDNIDMGSSHGKPTVDADVEAGVEADVEVTNPPNGDISNGASQPADDSVVAPPLVDSEDESEGESDKDIDNEEEYVVERIEGHTWNRGKLLYVIKWQGYPDSDNTREPEHNLLPHAKDLLAQYHLSIGGAPQRKPKATRGKVVKVAKASARAADSVDESPAPPPKRIKTSAPDSDDDETWTPKESNWEKHIDRIETVERDLQTDGLLAYIVFKNGRKTKVSMDMVYRHCPVPMLRFYEKHLSFK